MIVLEKQKKQKKTNMTGHIDIKLDEGAHSGK